MFEIISNFVEDLDSMYGSEIPQLRYYHILLQSSASDNEQGQEKQIGIFKDWVLKYQTDILEMNSAATVEPIKHSDKVFIDMNQILKLSKRCDINTIYKHLLLILAKANPQCDARNKLKSICQEKKASGSEGFIKDLVEDISQSININITDQNPDIGTVLNNIISSGAMAKIFSSVQTAMSNGDIDIGDLIKSTQNIVGKKPV
jgi:hypothetical protein